MILKIDTEIVKVEYIILIEKKKKETIYLRLQLDIELDIGY